MFLSGAVPPVADPKAPKDSIAAYGDTKTQTIGALTNIKATLEGMHLGMGDVVKMQAFLVGDPAKGGKLDFEGFMQGYTQFFGTAPQPNLPARSAMQVRSDHQCDTGRALDQPTDVILAQTIGVGDAFSQVPGLQPVFDQERFEEEAFIRHVLEYPPGIGAIAPSLIADILDRGKEGSEIGRSHRLSLWFFREFSVLP